MTEVEWLAICARDDKYASVQYCDTAIQDRRALIELIREIAPACGGIGVVLGESAQTVGASQS